MRVVSGHVGRISTGRPQNLSDRTLRVLVRTAARRNLLAIQLYHQLELKFSVCTVRRILQCVDWLSYTKMEKTLHLLDMHRVRRLAWPEEMLYTSQFMDVDNFSDETKWNLDGPDGPQHYWRHMRVSVGQTNRLQMGGGFVMVWGGFSGVRKTKLAILMGN